jgi:catecholate siderophore receptor
MIILLAAPYALAFSLHGKVLDPLQAPIAAARVTAVSAGGATAASAVTDDQGRFTVSLDPGAYTIKVASDGFMEATQKLSATSAGEESREIVLNLARFVESVNVDAPAGYDVGAIRSATKTLTPLLDVPQSVSVVSRELIRDQNMLSLADVVRYVPGIATHQGENNRDQVIIRGNNSSADFFLDGVRDDVQYYRDLYNLERVEALKGPNAMIFGRGGGGGVVNRVTKEAGSQLVRELTVQGGSYGSKRITGDFDQPIDAKLALRVNAMYEDSDSFRQDVNTARYAVNPTLTFTPTGGTKVTVGYERLHDARVADRGIPSFAGRPVDVDPSTYYGDPDDSRVRAGVHLASATVEHHLGGATLRNHTLFGDYDRSYQNFVPGAVAADQQSVALSAYNNATARRNVFNQTDVTYAATTGRLRHTLLGGVEVGRQSTDNFRNTGFFGGTATTISVPYGAPTIQAPVAFRQSATDADNHLRAGVAALYAQDQVEIVPAVQVIAGLRFDRFGLRYHNNRNGDTLDRTDDLLSPRAGIVVKPAAPVSLYGSYSVSYLPSSGDQFSSLTTITQQVEPEQFRNYEVGAKWDARSDLSLTAATYRLDRTNTRATDPNDATRIVQTGRQRTNGVELGVTGRVTGSWKVAGGYTYQDATVTSATTAARAGARVAQVPRHMLSLWNSYQLRKRLGAGLGIVHRADMFAAIDNTVTLPAYTRVDAALYCTLNRTLGLQVNAENVLNHRYFANADNNTNISPGSPRAVRVRMTMAF